MVLKHVCRTVSLLLILMLTFSMAASKNSSVQMTEYECEGNACSAVTFSWDNDRQQFRVQNNSEHAVKVVVSTFAGDSHAIIPPQTVGYLDVKTFNGPYHANYE